MGPFFIFLLYQTHSVSLSCPLLLPWHLGGWGGLASHLGFAGMNLNSCAQTLAEKQGRFLHFGLSRSVCTLQKGPWFQCGAPQPGTLVGHRLSAPSLLSGPQTSQQPRKRGNLISMRPGFPHDPSHVACPEWPKLVHHSPALGDGLLHPPVSRPPGWPGTSRGAPLLACRRVSEHRLLRGLEPEARAVVGIPGWLV